MAIDYDPFISTPWLVLNVIGQWCLLALLVTYALAKHLPQRNNPFLINFIFTSFISTIPPALLLYGDKRFGKASTGFCLAQAALVDGTAPMFALAQMTLVFDTWSELRSGCLHKSHLSRKPFVKYLLISAPYLAMCIWSISSLRASFDPQASRYDGFAYCIMSSPTNDKIHTAVGLFVTLASLVGLFFELWVCWMIYSYPTTAHKDPLVWRTNIQFAARVVIYSFLLFLAVALSIINLKLKISALKATTKLLTSSNALLAFIVFGTQKSVLRVWKFWDRERSPDYPEDLEKQSRGDPTLDWATIPAQLPAQFNGDREKGQPEPYYMKAWIRLRGG